MEYSSKQRTVDVGLYNVHRMHEKPVPATRKNQQPVSKQTKKSKPKEMRKKASKIHQPKQKDTTKPKKTSNQKETPKRACTERLAEQQKRSKRLTTISTMSDVADIMIDTSQNSTVHQVSDSSMDDVVCLTDNISRHKPFADFDTISGRHPFTVSVNSSIYYVSYIVF